LYGKDVEQDRVQALKWYRLASEQGDAAAQSNLCAELLRGNEIGGDLTFEGDLDEALHWCRLSAAQGYVGGLFQLGVCYLAGEGVWQDPLEAYVWLSLAELRAHDPGLRDRAAKLKALAMKYLTAEEITEAERRISPWRSAPP
jgi:TPR repeat protein